MRRTGDTLDFFRALEERPFAHDFLNVMRRVECLFDDKPRLGCALRPAHEPLRLGQEPSLSFAPAALSAFTRGEDGVPPRLEVCFFGLLGPNGPLPLHLTDYARERILHEGDRSFVRFLDLFNHRFLELFYRAWAQAQPAVSMDRPVEDPFAFYVGALFGIGASKLRGRDVVGDYAKLFYAGRLVRQARNRDGLEALAGGYFGIPVHVESYVGHWMTIAVEDQSRIGSDTPGARLGIGAVLGARVWDRQHKIRLVLGPLSLEQYQSFLPGGHAIERLVALVRQYLCFELEWDAKLMLKRSEVPLTILARSGRLGWDTWLGRYRRIEEAADLTLHAEQALKLHGGRAGAYA
jgi:type VI secretion system protein ImpH